MPKAVIAEDEALLRAELVSQPEFVVRFVAEAKLAVQLSHANVVQVFDLGRAGDELLLVIL